jgi:fluoride exporter
MTWVAVLLGGAFGSAARHGVNLMTARTLGTATPYATAAVNLIGSFAIGVLAGALATERLILTPTERTLLFTGILGGFTTFSSLMLDTLVLWQAGSIAKAVANLIGQLVIGCVLVYLGYRLGLQTAA